MNTYFTLSNDSDLFRGQNTWYEFRSALQQEICLDPKLTYEIALLSANFVDDYDDTFIPSAVQAAPVGDIESLAHELETSGGGDLITAPIVVPKPPKPRLTTAPTGRPLLKNMFPFLSCVICDVVHPTMTDFVQWPILRWLARPQCMYDTRTAAMLFDYHQGPEYHTVSVKKLHYFHIRLVGDFDERLKTDPQQWPITTLLQLHLRERQFKKD